MGRSLASFGGGAIAALLCSALLSAHPSPVIASVEVVDADSNLEAPMVESPWDDFIHDASTRIISRRQDSEDSRPSPHDYVVGMVDSGAPAAFVIDGNFISVCPPLIMARVGIACGL